MLVMIFIILCGASFTTSQIYAMAIRESDFRSYPRSVQAIVWDASIVESSVTTIISGLVRFPQGTLELAWIVDASQKARLQTLDPSGSAELPPHPVTIWPVLLADGTALLAKEFFPLFNSRQPVSVKVLGIVDSKELFAPLDLVEIPPGSVNYHELSGITYGQQYENHSVKIQEGILAHKRDPMSLLWQKAPHGSYKLAAVKEGLEIPLITLLDTKNSTAYIFEESSADAQGIRIDYLLYMGKTALDVLLEGFTRL